jgi:hypothetical protein
MRAKDISTQRFLWAVAEVGMRTHSRATMRWDVQAVLAGFPELVDVYGRDRSAVETRVPAKVVMAKARKLMAQGFLEGCDCGCRGDYEIRPAAAQAMGLVPMPGDRSGMEPPYGYWVRASAVDVADDAHRTPGADHNDPEHERSGNQ